jgi:4-hydroxy-tetrahydrodipicolinate reductase
VTAGTETGNRDTQAVRVVVAGPDGRMGRMLLERLPQEGIEVIGGLVRDDPRARELLADADVLVDFTNPESAVELMLTAIDAGVRPVSGTSGIPLDALDTVHDAAHKQGIGAVWAANFRIGGALTKHLSQIAAQYLDAVEIIEAHHAKKADAPSGTALDFARAIRAAHGSDLSDAPVERTTLPGVRGGVEGGVRVHSLRLPGLLSRHEIVFSGDDEILTIRHDDFSRTAYAPVVALAIREVMRPELVGLIRGLDAVLGLTRSQE